MSYGYKVVRLNFHSMQDYLECPRRYKFSTDRVPKTRPEDKYYAVFGSLVQRFFELYCNDEAGGRYRGVSSRKEVEVLCRPEWERILAKEPVNWKGFGKRLPPEEYFQSAVDCVWENIEAGVPFEQHRSEVKIVVTFKSGDKFVGILDFLGEDIPIDLDGGRVKIASGVDILDGKTTKEIGKNIKRDQVLAYAFLYWAHKKRMPDSIGFYYFRMRALDRQKVAPEEVLDFQKRMAKVIYDIKRDEEFEPKPCPKTCKYCDWQDKCPEYWAEKESRRRKKGPKPKELPGVGLVS